MELSFSSNAMICLADKNQSSFTPIQHAELAEKLQTGSE